MKIALLGSLLAGASALTFDPTNSSSIVDPANLVINGVMDYYNGNKSGGTPGMFQEPYYWWEAGVAWGAMLENWHFSRNNTYESLIKSSILFQSGNYWNFMTFNQTSVEGNDDQAFWGITAMAAAERNFTPPGTGWPSTWLYFAQATFNSMANRWDTTHCGGGLRWQIYTWNAGYDYKNSVSNGCLFHLASRLYRFTNNQTFAIWAEKVWQWMADVELIANVTESTTAVYDGTSIANDCSGVSQYEWTYDQGLMLAGAAAMYNATGNSTWLTRVKDLWNRAEVFFVATSGNKPAMLEAACQPRQANDDWSKWTSDGNWTASTCNNDQRVFKGIFSRFLGYTMAVAPESKEWIWDYMTGTGTAVAQSCSGGFDGHTCGLNWLVHGYDGVYGLGEQISALDVLSVLMMDRAPAPYTASQLPEIYKSTGTNNSTRGSSGNGTSSSGGGEVFGYGDAGLNSSSSGDGLTNLNLSTKDTAGAGVATAFAMILVIGASCWLIL